MQIIEFSEFARRRTARGAPDTAAEARPIFPASDRWAALHSALPDSLDESAGDVDDFWSDLNFRIAYPTHRMRRH